MAVKECSPVTTDAKPRGISGLVPRLRRVLLHAARTTFHQSPEPTTSNRISLLEPLESPFPQLYGPREVTPEALSRQGLTVDQLQAEIIATNPGLATEGTYPVYTHLFAKRLTMNTPRR